MKGVIFDIEGTFAHFRKFYTNSSALTHTVPPRTTLMGLIAGMIGEERGSYYEALASDKLLFAVKKNRGTHSLTQTLNYWKVDSSGELMNPKMHTQIPFEILVGDDGPVSYRVVAASEDGALMDELGRRIRMNRFVYPPSLGTAFFQADVAYVAEHEVTAVEAEGKVTIDSIVPVEAVEALDLDCNRIIREKMPRDFEPDRTVRQAIPYLVDERGQAIRLLLKKGGSYQRIGDMNVLFM